MTNIDAESLERHFAALCDLDPEARAEGLRTLARQDAALARRVAALLDAHDAGPLDPNRLAERELRSLAVFDNVQWAGRKLGGWTLTHELGRGGLGVVYAAKRCRDDVHERAAIKLLQAPGLDAEGGQRFVREAAMLARLDHPGICRLRDWGRSEEGWPYLVLDLIEGRPINEAARALNLTQKIALVARLADALGAAHRQLIVHLDIKPDNVLVDARGAPVVLDFGIARILREDGGAATTTLMRWLTPDYASPEQLKGEPTSVASDLYSLGALLYELVAGQRPFDLAECTWPEALERIEHGPIRPSQRVAGAGRDLDAVIGKAMHPDPARRYESASAFADDLRAIVQKRPVRARPDSFLYRLSRLFRRNPIAAPVSVLAVLSISLLAGLLAIQSDSLRAERDRAELQAERARAATDLLFGAIQSADPTGERGSAATVDELLEATVRRIDAGTLGDPVLAAESLVRIADVRESLGEFDAAIDLYRRALAWIEDDVPLDSEPRVSAVAGLASALRQAGRVDEARGLLDDALALLDTTTHWKFLLSRANVAITEGRNDQAETFLDRALAGVPEDAHPNRASILSSFGFLRNGVGQYADALDWYRSAEQSARMLPVDREQLATILLNIANAESKLGNIEAALIAADESLNLRIEMFGEQHTRTVPSVLIHAYVFMEAGRWDEAIAMARRAAELEQQLTGATSPRMAAIWSAIGLAAERKGDRALAREGFSRALEVQRRVLPANHPAIAGTQVNLASTMMAAGDYAESLEPLKQAWEIHTEAAVGKPSRARAIAAVNIAYCYIRLEQLEPALRWAHDALAEAEQVLLPDQWLLGHFRNVHAEALFINGRIDEARSEALSVEELYAASSIPVRTESVHENLSLLARVFEAVGDAERAASYSARLHR
jgi:serine/threonine-protein kinase